MTGDATEACRSKAPRPMLADAEAGNDTKTGKLRPATSGGQGGMTGQWGEYERLAR